MPRLDAGRTRVVDAWAALPLMAFRSPRLPVIRLSGIPADEVPVGGTALPV